MIEAIVLAAGSSQRMGNENKLLKPYKKDVIIRSVLKEIIASNVEKVIVVLGHQDGAIREALHDLNVETVFNSNYHRGQVWSIRAGLGLVSSRVQGVLIGLADMPLLEAVHINRVITYFKKQRPSNHNLIVRPKNESEIGHPIIWDSTLIKAMKGHTDNESMKGLIEQHNKSYLPFVTKERGYFVDVDTPLDYQKLAI